MTRVSQPSEKSKTNLAAALDAAVGPDEIRAGMFRYGNALSLAGFARLDVMRVWTSERLWRLDADRHQWINEARAERDAARERWRLRDALSPREFMEARDAYAQARDEFEILYAAYADSLLNDTLEAERQAAVARREAAEAEFDQQGADDAEYELTCLQTSARASRWRLAIASLKETERAVS